MLESLKTKRNEENYAEMENDISRSSMNAMWEELKNDTWWNMAHRLWYPCWKPPFKKKKQDFQKILWL